MHRVQLLPKLLGLLQVVVLSLGPGILWAEALTPAVVTKIMPAAKHANLDQTIAGLLTHYHYRQNKLDDEISYAILDAYLESLDFNRSFFLDGDIQEFRRKYGMTLDDHLQTGNLQPAYEIYNRYQERLSERIARLRIQLERPVNFDVSESLVLDRENAPWPRNRTDLDEIWRKRLKHELLQLMLAGKNLDEARETLLRRYEGRLRRTAQSNSEDVFQLYMNAVSRSFDPHTAYFSPRTSENFNIQMRLSLEGIGTVLRMEEEQITVVELVPGGPADLSDAMYPKDKIVGVAQGDEGPMVDVVGWRLDDVVDLIRGPKGSVVRLQVISGQAPPGDPGRGVRLVRDTIKLEKQAASSEILTVDGEDGQESRIGVINIPTFYSDFAAAQRGDPDYRSTTRDVRVLLEELKAAEVDSVVIDLRQNGGGSLQEAVSLTGLFIEQGPVVQVRNARGSVDVEEDGDTEVVYDGPLVVLVNRFSASASEIFAGAVQDYGRGLVVGAPTFGKGTVQTLVDLNRFLPKSGNQLGQLKLTVAKFYRVNGASTQHRGVVPDLGLPSMYDPDEVGESAQDFALPWDEINPTNYQVFGNELSLLLPDLKRLHHTRVDGDPGYSVFMENIREAKKIRDRSEVSPLKAERQRQREMERQARLERENRLRATRGVAPLQDLDDVNDDDVVETPDILLEETVNIASDLAKLLNRHQHVVMTVQ